jgi:hypothetical protein
MPDFTRKDFEEVRAGLGQNLKNFEKQASIQKGTHPRLYQETLKKIRSYKRMIEETDQRIKEFESPVQEISLPEKGTKFFDRFKTTSIHNSFSCSNEIREKEKNNLNLKHYRALILMAKNNGILHAKDAKSIAQSSFVYNAAFDDIALWSPLVNKGFVSIKKYQPIGDQKAFFSKGRDNTYRSKGKGLSGFEPSSYSIGNYALTKKGWKKVLEIDTMTKNKESKCYVKNE